MTMQTPRRSITATLFGLWTLLFALQNAHGQTAYPLTPISGADGVFETVMIDGMTVYRSAGTPGEYAIYMYFQADVAVQATTAYVEVTYLDLGVDDLLLQYNSTTSDYELATARAAADLQDTQGARTAVFELPNADFRNAQNLGTDLRIATADPDVQKHIVSAVVYMEPPPTLNLSTPAPSFSMDSHTVSTSVFHWYAPTAGQLDGPWPPVEGRENWTGETRWWKTQVKQMMAANIDVLYVHLINHSESVRVNLFQALAEMRAEGYDVPRVAPFLDPLVTWFGQPNVDLGTTAGKDTLAAQYIRFYNQYFSVNTDDHAEDYLAKMDGRPILDTWHLFVNIDNVDSMTRADLEGRLRDALSSDHPAFDNGIYMVTTALNDPTYSFTDERVPQFEINEYYWSNTFNGLTTVQLKGGYWDQNIRDPGDFLPRDGGVPYAEAWDQIDETVDRVYIESWNEYDEGTGIYAANTGAPFILPGSGNINTDTWSASGDPYEYIRTTARGAAAFNDTPEQDATILRHTLPSRMQAGEVVIATVTVRNAGDASWSGREGYRFGQNTDLDPVLFAEADALIDDARDDIPAFGGIFRGRPTTFVIELTAPDTPDTYTTHWGMWQDEAGRFGESLEVSIEVAAPTGVTIEASDVVVPATYVLSQNYPNPFNPSTRVAFALPESGEVRLAVYDVLGREVAVLLDRELPAGTHEAIFEAARLPSGVYIYRLEAGPFIKAQRMLLVK